MAKLLAPNGKPSNLSPEQYELVRTPAFKEWFGDWENDPENASKVIDENGEPLVVFHGTTESFSVFNNEYSVGHYFTSKIEVAKTYSNNTISCFLDIKNPTYWDVNCRDWEDVRDGVENLASSLWWVVNKKESQIVYINKGEEQINMQLNCDGIIIKNIIDVDLMFDKNNKKWCADTIIVSSSNQIKLADGTNTTFDGSNPDIRYAGGGETDEKEFVIQELDKDYKEVFQVRGYKNIGGSDFFFSRLKYSEQNVFTIELPSGKEIGRATLDEKENYLINIRIDENYRRKGLGLNLYNFIEYVTGKKLKPSPIKISQEAQALWIKRNPDILFKEGGLIAPNRKPSNLTAEQYKLVRTPAFISWFGDWQNDPANSSKVVDENGEPLVCYHNSNSQNINVFKSEKGFGYTFFATDINTTFRYGGKKIYSCFINSRKTFDVKKLNEK